LKAVAEKLIPGIPIPTRISILQQTATDEQSSLESTQVDSATSSSSQLSVLEEVIDRATSRNEIQREIDGESCFPFHCRYHVAHAISVLSKAVNEPENALSPLRALRRVKHERLKKELFEHDKDARLRSGTRGMAARKALIAFEKIVAESTERQVW
jgi:hypothetical protein